MSGRVGAGIDAALVQPTADTTRPWSNRGPVDCVFPSGELPPAASPVFRRGWLAGARYVLEALEAGTPVTEVNIVVDVVGAEAEPKRRRFSRRSL